MPPKAGPPKLKTTVRKSALQPPPPVSSRCTSASSQDSPAAAPPPAGSRSTSGLSLNGDGVLLSSPDSKYQHKIQKSSPPGGETNSPANPSSVPQDKIKNIGSKSVKKIKVGKKDQVDERAIANLGSAAPLVGSCGTQDAILPRHKSLGAGGAGYESESGNGEGGGSSTSPGAIIGADAGREVVKGKGGDEAIPEVGKAATEAGGSAKVVECKTRKVLKKTVRIVKKIVKRRVPKRVVTSVAGNEETKGIMPALDSMEVAKLDSNATQEKVGSGGNFVNTDSNCTNGNEKMETVGNVDSFKQRDESVESATSELNSIEVGTIGHSGTLSMEAAEISKINCTAAVEIGSKDSKEIQVLEAEIPKSNRSAETVVKGENAEELGDSTCGSSSRGFAADEDDVNESLMVEDQLETGNLNLVEMKDGDHLEDSSGEGVQERRPDGKEKSDVGLNVAPALSCEMEALERRKRRRTELFVGGLDKDTKEVDIRKQFEQVGKVKRVRLVKDSDSGKSRGFAFLQFASAADAKKALENFSTVEICGRQCGVKPVEGNDTIYLGNINKKWKSEDVVQQLNVAKIKNIDKVIVMANPSNFEINRGFAFLEFQTSRDAQIAFSKLQKYDVFVKQMKIKVAWAQPLVEPDEEEMQKVKSVYAEYLPLSWDEAKAKTFFKRFGEIESITLAKNLTSSWRKDFAFVNYSTREAALACIEAFAHEQVDDAGTKVKIKVSLAKPKVKQTKRASVASGKEPVTIPFRKTKQVLGTSGKEPVKEKQFTSNAIKFHEPLQIEKHTSNNLGDIRVDKASSTTDELLQILRQQARVGQPRPGSFHLNHHYASERSAQPISSLANHATFPEPRRFPYTYPEISHVYGSTSAFSSRAGTIPLPYPQRQPTGYRIESPAMSEKDPHFEPRERAAYLGHSGMYQRCKLSFLSCF